MNKIKRARLERLLLGHVPRYIRCYDSGPDSTADRYTVVYTGLCGGDYVGMSANPFHPQGVGQHGNGLIDRVAKDRKFLWPPAIGKKNHLGTRILFNALPDPCRRLVCQDYSDAWGLNFDEVWAYCNPPVERVF